MYTTAFILQTYVIMKFCSLTVQIRFRFRQLSKKSMLLLLLMRYIVLLVVFSMVTASIGYVHLLNGLPLILSKHTQNIRMVIGARMTTKISQWIRYWYLVAVERISVLWEITMIGATGYAVFKYIYYIHKINTCHT